jgi:hypothetical protein
MQIGIFVETAPIAGLFIFILFIYLFLMPKSGVGYIWCGVK